MALISRDLSFVLDPVQSQTSQQKALIARAKERLAKRGLTGPESFPGKPGLPPRKEYLRAVQVEITKETAQYGTTAQLQESQAEARRKAKIRASEKESRQARSQRMYEKVAGVPAKRKTVFKKGEVPRGGLIQAGIRAKTPTIRAKYFIEGRPETQRVYEEKVLARPKVQYKYVSPDPSYRLRLMDEKPYITADTPPGTRIWRAGMGPASAITVKGVKRKLEKPIEMRMEREVQPPSAEEPIEKPAKPVKPYGLVMPTEKMTPEEARTYGYPPYEQVYLPPTYTLAVEKGKRIVKGVPKEGLERTSFMAGIRAKVSEKKYKEAYRKGEYVDFASQAAKAYGAGIVYSATTTAEALRHPVRTVKGVYQVGKAFVKEPAKTTSLFYTAMKEAVTERPVSTAGFVTGEVLTAKGLGTLLGKTGKAAKALGVPTFATETVEIYTKGGKKVLKTFGIEKKGKAVVLLTKTDEGITLGKPKPEKKIPLSELKEVPPPATAVGTKALTETLALTPEEMARVGYARDIVGRLIPEKGRKVKEALYSLEQLRSPEKVTPIIESFISEEKGVVFGSITMQQLPEGFRFKPGDIDVIIPGAKKAALEPKIETLAEQLRKAGEKVQVSPTNKLIIESVYPPYRGKKVVEVKAGAELDAADDLARTGVFGFEFADLKKGQISRTVRFGEARAITAGEQTARKAAGATFFRGEAPTAPAPFQKPGVYPRETRMKDLPGFITQAKGLIELRRQETASKFFGIPRTIEADVAVQRYKETFTPLQRAQIDVMTKELMYTERKIGVPLERTPTASEYARRFAKETITPGIAFESTLGLSISPRREISPSPKLSPYLSPSIPPIYSPYAKITSPYVSPKPKYPSPAPSPSPSMLYYGFRSIYPSPVSSLRSLSPAPSPAPSPAISPAPSPTPSPAPSPSPFPSPGPPPPPPPPIITPFTLPGRKYFARKKEKIPKPRKRTYAPTLTAIAVGAYGKPMKKVTGLEIIRPIPGRRKMTGLAASLYTGQSFKMDLPRSRGL